MVESFAIELSLMAADAIETSMKHAASLVVSVVKFKCIMAAKDGRFSAMTQVLVPFGPTIRRGMIKSREDRKRFEATLTTGLKELGLDQLKVVWLAEELRPSGSCQHFVVMACSDLDRNERMSRIKVSVSASWPRKANTVMSETAWRLT